MIERMIARGLRELARSLLAAAPIVRRAGGLPRQFCARCGQSSCNGSQCGYPPAPRWSARAVRPESQWRKIPGGWENMRPMTPKPNVHPPSQTTPPSAPSDDSELLAPWRAVAAREGSRL